MLLSAKLAIKLRKKATWFNGEVTGDEGCFDGTAEPVESDEWVTGCWTQRTSITKGDDTVYNILRMHYALEEPEDLKFDISKLQSTITFINCKNNDYGVFLRIWPV